jgi:sulfur-carrier protein adenylyltransferase/sulfurtransferase
MFFILLFAYICFQSKSFIPLMLNDAEKRRYRRHIMLSDVGLEGQEKLKAARVLVVGAGGLGAPVLQYLTAAGVGTIIILDNDTVNDDNLHRQILYGGHDLGKLKTIIARDRLNMLNTMVNHEIFNIRLNPLNAFDFISRADIVVDATDNYSTRYLINDACILLGKPWIFGSIFKYEGQVSTFLSNRGPSLRCLYPEGIKVPNPENYGMLGVLPGIIGSLQACEALKIILGKGELLCGKLLIYNMMNNLFRQVEFTRKNENFSLKKLKENY